MAQGVDVECTWWQPDRRRFSLTPHEAFTYTIRNNRTDRAEYYFSSSITRSQHPCFSHNEYLFYSWLDVLPEVRTFKSQPPSIEYSSDGKTYSYTADTDVFLIDDSRTYVEVKSENQALSDEYLKKWPAIKQAAAARNRQFTLVTDQDLKAEPLHTNIHTVRAERHSKPPRDVVQRMEIAFEGDSTVPFARLLECANEELSLARMHLLHLICMRHFTFDFATNLVPDTPVRLARAGRSGPYRPVQ